jgi:hypothetical protein
MKLKRQILKVTLLACFANSLAFADNPTDEPLVFAEANTAAAGRGVAKDASKDGKKNRAEHRRGYRKHEERPVNVKMEDSSKKL